jgi:hypothetical protein
VVRRSALRQSGSHQNHQFASVHLKPSGDKWLRGTYFSRDGRWQIAGWPLARTTPEWQPEPDRPGQEQQVVHPAVLCSPSLPAPADSHSVRYTHGGLREAAGRAAERHHPAKQRYHLADLKHARYVDNAQGDERTRPTATTVPPDRRGWSPSSGTPWQPI